MFKNHTDFNKIKSYGRKDIIGGKHVLEPIIEEEIKNSTLEDLVFHMGSNLSIESLGQGLSVILHFPIQT
jgi:hypothetical protein